MHVCRAPVDVMHLAQIQLLWLPADLLQRLPPQGLIWRFARIQEPPKSPQQPGTTRSGTG